MKPELKEAISEKIKLARKELEDNPGLKAKLEKQGQKLSLSGDRKCPKTALQILVERKLRKQRIWKELRIELVSAALAGFIREFERNQAEASSKVELSAARERQLALFPGFEKLPTRIRKGNNYLKFPDAPIPDYLVWAAKYDQRSQRDQQTADEVRRIAKAVEPYAAETGLTVSAGYERAQAEAPAVIVMKPRQA